MGKRSRASRLDYPGAIYHLLNRGDWREPIIRDGTDRNAFWKCSPKPAARAICNCMPTV